MKEAGPRPPFGNAVLLSLPWGPLPAPAFQLPRWGVLAGLVLVFWPLFAWWTGRSAGAAEGGWPLAALIGIVFLTRWKTFLQPVDERTLVRLCAGLAVMLPFLAEGSLPPLARGLAAAGFAAVLWHGTGAPPALCLMPFLLLPVADTADFYLGYPLRAFVAEGSALLLRTLGVYVSVSGTGLVHAGREVWVDAPCSGLRMLWFGGWMTLVAATLARLHSLALVWLGLAALVLLIALNVLRATLLFFPESGLCSLPAWSHGAIGAACFLAAGGLILLLAQRLQSFRIPPAGETPPNAIKPARRVVLFFPVLCLFGLGLTFLPHPGPKPDAITSTGFPGWPSSLEGRALESVPLSAKEAAFLRDFPGHTAAFQDEDGRWIVRWVTAPTRRLHPARHCFAGSGHQIQPEGIVRDGWETLWGSFQASKEGQTWTVRERIGDAAGNNWTDVSSWYWAAVLGRTQGPWWVYTRITQDS
ncbi:MAG: archaeosortase/exosortase family protein [Candidatus Methylacidiphilales bacterium]|nr:archaeosortase/exosortase family protein [Candidatus Methylacidiphilales bacterium]